MMMVVEERLEGTAQDQITRRQQYNPCTFSDAHANTTKHQLLALQFPFSYPVPVYLFFYAQQGPKM